VVGALSAVVALLVALLGLPDQVASAIGRTASKTAELELEQKRVELAEAGARLDVKYILLRQDLLYFVTGEGAKPRGAGAAATTLQSYRVAKTEILDELAGNGPRPSPCWGDDYYNLAVTFLAVSNRGRRDAANVQLTTQRLDLGRVVGVRERTGGGDDYVAKLRAAAGKRTPVPIAISETLAPGQGILIPLWLTGARRDRPGTWCVVSRVAFNPVTLSFADAALGSRKGVKVRRMVTPTILALGIEGRG
jgi:hypothetical protein